MKHLPKSEIFDFGKLPEPGPQTESSKERGFVSDTDEAELGQTESVESDAGSDIADEGPGHRG
jgi:hypothetical protein